MGEGGARGQQQQQLWVTCHPQQPPTRASHCHLKTGPKDSRPRVKAAGNLSRRHWAPKARRLNSFGQSKVVRG